MTTEAAFWSKVANIAKWYMENIQEYKNIAGLENRRKRIDDDNAYCLVLVSYFMD